MFLFTKEQRLLNRKQYNHCFEQSKKTITPEFVIFSCSNQTSISRLGLAISKKSVRKAHDRNRLKRLIRESFRLTQLPPLDVIFVARKGTETVSNHTILERLKKTWPKLKA